MLHLAMTLLLPVTTRPLATMFLSTLKRNLVATRPTMPETQLSTCCSRYCTVLYCTVLYCTALDKLSHPHMSAIKNPLSLHRNPCVK